MATNTALAGQTIAGPILAPDDVLTIPTTARVTAATLLPNRSFLTTEFFHIASA